MPFEDCDDLPSRTVPRKFVGKALRLFAVVFGAQHAGYDRDLGAGRNELAHQLSRQAAIQNRFHADHAGTPAPGSVGRDADDPYAPGFGIVDQELEFLGIAGGEDDAVDAALHQFLEGLGIVFSQHLHRTVHELDAQRSHPPGFV